MSPSVVTLVSGQLRGARESGVARFLGVPYAAAPVGELRFRAPQPCQPWQGERDATRFGPSAPYRLPPFDALDLEPLVGMSCADGDDYLNLNVWTPDEKASGLPVMVFIHGGAWTGGSGSAPAQDGSAFARDGVVCVTINYRVGIEGFLPIEDAPTNLGLRDMIFALEWVRDNIAAFGGDPATVTVFGESAGAMSIADLMTSPAARGLFRRAIIQSGHGSMTRSIATNRKVARKVARLLGVPATAEAFRRTTFEQGLDAVARVQMPNAGLDLRGPNGREPTYGLSKFTPVHGDDVLPVQPLEAARTGAGAEVELLIGTNAEEMNLYFVPTGVRDKINAVLTWFLLGRVERNAGAILRAYRGPGKRPGQVFTEALTDLVFRWPARAFAAAHKGRTHMYEFDWRSPAIGGQLGAAHAVDVPFVFETVDKAAGPKGLLGEAPPRELAARIHRLWVDFAKDGSLPWPEYTADARRVFQLEAGTVRTETDDDFPVARFWRP